MARKVIIMVGCSGSGKSTFIREHLKGFESFSADHYFESAIGEYNFDPSLLGEAHSCCLRNYVEYLTDTQQDLVVDNTNTTVAEIAPYAALALAYQCELEIVVLNNSWEKVASRNVHNVPESVVKSQWERIQKTLSELPPWWKVVRM